MLSSPSSLVGRRRTARQRVCCDKKGQKSVFWHGKGWPGPPQDHFGHGERFPSLFSARLEVGEWERGAQRSGDGGWLVRGCPLPHFFLGYGRGWRRNAPPSGEDPARGEGLVEAVRIGAVSGHFWLAHGRTVGGTPLAGLPRGARGLRGLSRGHSRLQTTPFVNSHQKLDFSSFFLREKKKRFWIFPSSVPKYLRSPRGTRASPAAPGLCDAPGALRQLQPLGGKHPCGF